MINKYATIAATIAFFAVFVIGAPISYINLNGFGEDFGWSLFVLIFAAVGVTLFVHTVVKNAYLAMKCKEAVYAVCVEVNRTMSHSSGHSRMVEMPVFYTRCANGHAYVLYEGAYTNVNNKKVGMLVPIMVNPEKYDYTKANTLVDVLYKFQESTWDTLADKFPQLSDLIYSTQENISEMNYFLGINIAETPMSMFKSALAVSAFGMMIVAVLIPLLAGGSQFLSAKIMQKSTASANKSDKDNQMMQQMNMMMKVMPLMSVVMCFSMPAGLGIYWITSAVVRTIQQVCVNKSLNKKSIDDIVKENVEKAAKKRANKNEVESKTLNQMAQRSTRNIEDNTRKTVSTNNVDSYKPNAKPGSLASKANMVSDFNNRNK